MMRSLKFAQRRNRTEVKNVEYLTIYRPYELPKFVNEAKKEGEHFEGEAKDWDNAQSASSAGI